MGERFGFYIMMAILALFLVSKFGLEKTEATTIYATFYALIYLLALAVYTSEEKVTKAIFNHEIEEGDIVVIT